MKKFIGKIFCICAILTVFFIIHVAAGSLETNLIDEDAKIIESGTCGDNATWTLYDNYELIVSGTGEISSYVWHPYKNLIETVIIESGITSIGPYAFWSCDRIKEIIIPNSVSAIGQGAFERCESLKNITIPNSVSTIGLSSFDFCKSLESITIPSSVTSIEGSVFTDCTALACINVDPGNKFYSSDETGVLFNKDKTELLCYPAGNTAATYDIPDGVKTVGPRAFWRCIYLTSVNFPDSVTSVGEYTFMYSINLKSVDLSDNLTNLSTCMFRYCSISNIDIPESVTSIGSQAFSNCYSLTSITIPHNVTYLGSWAFGYCDSLTTINIPNGITTISEFTFRDCVSLKKIEIPGSVTIIDNYAFSGCTGLESVVIPNCEITLGDSVFHSCHNLKEIKIYAKDATFWQDVFFGVHEDFKIYGYADSTARTYAHDNNYPFVVLNEWQNPFEDVKETDEYYEAVVFAVNKGLFNGTSSTTFDPDVTMNRAMFVTVLGRLDSADMSAYNVATPTFGDVKAGEWYTPYVEWAAANNIVNGMKEGNKFFGVYYQITIEEACTILARYNGFETAADSGYNLTTFSDAEEISDWAVESMKWAVENGIYTGEGDLLSPSSPASRALIATMFANYIKVFN